MKNATTREIKFRAWVDGFLPEQSGMFTVFSLERIQADGSADRITATRSGRVAVVTKFKSEEEPFVLMQYTGLKDKNGTEVYEGDIVQYDTANGQNREEVIWDGLYGRFALRPINYTSNTELAFWVKNSEVIGNIHENPELLK